MINWKRVRELEQDIGPDDIGEVVELFLEEVEGVMDPLRKGKGVQNMREDMHFLKGTALNLGFDALGALCSEAEKMAASGETKTGAVSEIILAYDASKVEFMAGISPI
jgi:histidine phosphotransfer protein HptB